MPHSIFLMYNPSVLCLPGFSYLQAGPRPDTGGDEIQVWFSLSVGKGERARGHSGVMLMLCMRGIKYKHAH